MLPKSMKKTLTTTKILNWINLIVMLVVGPRVSYLLLKSNVAVFPVLIFASGLIGLTYFRWKLFSSLKKGKRIAWVLSIALNIFDFFSVFFPFAIVNLYGLLKKDTQEYFLGKDVKVNDKRLA